jgi:hypothetical protein
LPISTLTPVQLLPGTGSVVFAGSFAVYAAGAAGASALVRIPVAGGNPQTLAAAFVQNASHPFPNDFLEDETEWVTFQINQSGAGTDDGNDAFLMGDPCGPADPDECNAPTSIALF